MTATIIPSTGEVRQGAYLNLNWMDLTAGDRVLFEVEFGRPRIDTIDLVEGNVIVIDGVRLCVTAAKARVGVHRSPEWCQALISALEGAYETSPHTYKEERQRLIRKAKRMP